MDTNINGPSSYYFSFHINHSDDHWPASLLGMPFCHTVVWDSVPSPFFPGCHFMSGHFMLSRHLENERIQKYLAETNAGFVANINTSVSALTSTIDLSRTYPNTVRHHMVTLNQTICTCILSNLSQVSG